MPLQANADLCSAPAVDATASLGCRRDWGTLVLPQGPSSRCSHFSMFMPVMP